MKTKDEALDCLQFTIDNVFPIVFPWTIFRDLFKLFKTFLPMEEGMLRLRNTIYTGQISLSG